MFHSPWEVRQGIGAIPLLILPAEGEQTDVQEVAKLVIPDTSPFWAVPCNKISIVK